MGFKGLFNVLSSKPVLNKVFVYFNAFKSVLILCVFCDCTIRRNGVKILGRMEYNRSPHIRAKRPFFPSYAPCS